jgi:hypothetical protein
VIVDEGYVAGRYPGADRQHHQREGGYLEVVRRHDEDDRTHYVKLRVVSDVPAPQHALKTHRHDQRHW